MCLHAHVILPSHSACSRPFLCPWKDHRDGKLLLLVTGESRIIFFLLKCIPVPWGECISFSTLEPHNSTCILELLIVVQGLLKKLILPHYLTVFFSGHLFCLVQLVKEVKSKQK